MPAKSPRTIELPAPSLEGGACLDQALASRRSVRDFRDEGLDDRQLSRLLWATQGITGPEGTRTSPSAGGLYPLEIYVALERGFYHYEPESHRLVRRSDRDPRRALYRAALRQEAVRDAPTVFVIAAVYRRIEDKYGEERGPRYVHIEVGHAAQNLHLEAVALGLGSVPIGAFHDDQVRELLDLPTDHQPLYVVPVGQPR